MKSVKFYISAHCGNVVEMVHDAGVKRPMCSSPHWARSLRWSMLIVIFTAFEKRN